jgi:predicted kinase
LNRLILTVGLPRSGKSTWAKKQGYPIVNPDAIRLALYGQRFIKEGEEMVWAIAKYMVRSLFLAGHETVTLDATNTTKRRRDEWLSSNWRCEFKCIYTSKDECIKRAIADRMEDLVPIIEDMDSTMDREGLT